MWAFENETEIKEIDDRFRIKYNIIEFISDYYNPFIVHFPGTAKTGIKNSRYIQKWKEYLEMAINITNKFN